MTQKKDPSFEENWLFIWKKTWRFWWTLTWAVETLKIFTLMGNFFRKYVMFELKRYRGVVLWKMKLFKFLQFLKPAFAYINFAPFCNILATKTYVSSVNGIVLKPQSKVYREASIFYFNASFFWCSLIIKNI